VPAAFLAAIVKAYWLSQEFGSPRGRVIKLLDMLEVGDEN
jgi:hypothetical protein